MALTPIVQWTLHLSVNDGARPYGWAPSCLNPHFSQRERLPNTKFQKPLRNQSFIETGRLPPKTHCVFLPAYEPR